MKWFPISIRYLPAAVVIEVWIIINVISSHTIEHQSCKCCTYTCTASCLCQCWLQHAKQDQDAIIPFLFNLQNVIFSLKLPASVVNIWLTHHNSKKPWPFLPYYEKIGTNKCNQDILQKPNLPDFLHPKVWKLRSAPCFWSTGGLLKFHKLGRLLQIT